MNIELFQIAFVSVRLMDLLDIGLMSLLLYQFYQLFRRSAFLQLLLVLLLLFLLWRVTEMLNMVLMRSLLSNFLEIGAIALVIVFAPELRRMLLGLNRQAPFERLRRQLSTEISASRNFDELLVAIETLAETRTGAIIVLQGSSDLSSIIESGDRINADVSKRLLMSVFNPKSPLHDGAAIIKDNTLMAARCVLPISDDPDLPPELGLRHRSGLGVTEISDAAAIIVSEETGKVALASEGRLKRNLSQEELQQFLKKFYELGN